VLGDLDVDRHRAFVGGNRSCQVATEEVERAPSHQGIGQTADGEKGEPDHPPVPADRPRVRAPSPETPNPVRDCVEASHASPPGCKVSSFRFISVEELTTQHEELPTTRAAMLGACWSCQPASPVRSTPKRMP